MKIVLFLISITIICLLLAGGVLADPPTNDECANADDAGTLVAGYPIQLTGTTEDATNDCDEIGETPEVWIKFTLTSCMDVTIDFCDDTNEVLSSAPKLFDGCPCGESNFYYYGGVVDCPNYNPSLTWKSLAAGTYYYPILADDGGSLVLAGGPYTVNVSATDCPLGACCDDGGETCYDTITELDCINNYEGTWMGAGTECGEQDSETGIYEGCQEEPETGACCYNNGDGTECVVTDEETCYDDYNGDWMGSGTDCTDDNDNGIADVCEGSSTGACCFDNGDGTECVVTDEETCSNEYEGDWKGEGTDCTDNDGNEIADICEEAPTGACCYQDGSITECVVTDEETCSDELGGTWMGSGTDCTDSDENEIADICEEPDTYNYLPGDANMAAETWPAQTIGGDVTFLVNYFRGLADPCYLDGFYASADATGDCLVVGGDVTYLVNYFRGLNELNYCTNYEPAWPTPSDVPTDAPDGWPNCD